MSHHILQGVRFVQVFRDLLVDQVVPKDGISEKMRGLCVLNIRILSCSSSQNYDNKSNLKTEHCLIDHTFGDDLFKFYLSRFDCFQGNVSSLYKICLVSIRLSFANQTSELNIESCYMLSILPLSTTLINQICMLHFVPANVSRETLLFP